MRILYLLIYFFHHVNCFTFCWLYIDDSFSPCDVWEDHLYFVTSWSHVGSIRLNPQTLNKIQTRITIELCFQERCIWLYFPGLIVLVIPNFGVLGARTTIIGVCIRFWLVYFLDDINKILLIESSLDEMVMISSNLTNVLGSNPALGVQHC